MFYNLTGYEEHTSFFFFSFSQKQTKILFKAKIAFAIGLKEEIPQILDKSKEKPEV